jgi:CDP-6-deoxy-D-xylo-4-hexulose-3-dehydrase
MRRIDHEERYAMTETTPRELRYAQVRYGSEEIEAILRVLDEPSNLMIGRNVAEMERRVAALFGKPHGVMCNSGSSALYLAVELLALSPGDEVITSPIVFSTDLAPLLRAGLMPVFVDVEPDTFQIDVEAIEAAIGPRTRALLVPNLTGNAPDWDAIRAVADRHRLLVVEDSCDALGLTLRGTPTGTRSDITVTSFALAHHITCAGHGGMVMVESEELRDRCLMLRRWGRRSELLTYGSRKGERNLREDLDGVAYDSSFIFDEVAWNFEPNELCAAFGVAQLDRLPELLARRKRNFELLDAHVRSHPDMFIPPRTTAEVDTVWQTFCFLVRPDAGFTRSDLQEHLEACGISTRTVWTGNAARQPMMQKVAFRQPPGGLPNADLVFSHGMLVPSGPAMTDDDVSYICEAIDSFVGSRR